MFPSRRRLLAPFLPPHKRWARAALMTVLLGGAASLQGPVWAQAPSAPGSTAADAAGVMQGPRYQLSLVQMQSLVAERFPRRFDLLPGWANATAQAPKLGVLPQNNQLRATLALQVTGPALQRPVPGTLDVAFALRYEPRDHSLRAHQIKVLSFELQGLPPQVNMLLGDVAPALAQQSLNEVVLHPLTAQELGLMDSMGLMPGPITVTNEGLVMQWIIKPL